MTDKEANYIASLITAVVVLVIHFFIGWLFMIFVAKNPTGEQFIQHVTFTLVVHTLLITIYNQRKES